MNLNKDASSWAKVIPKSVIAHSSPQAAENVLAMALEDIGKMDFEIVRLKRLLMAARRYADGYAENKRNHPQARDGAINLSQQIAAALT